jgi:hypothetical protein
MVISKISLAVEDAGLVYLSLFFGGIDSQWD